MRGEYEYQSFNSDTDTKIDVVTRTYWKEKETDINRETERDREKKVLGDLDRQIERPTEKGCGGSTKTSILIQRHREMTGKVDCVCLVN